MEQRVAAMKEELKAGDREREKISTSFAKREAELLEQTGGLKAEQKTL